MLTKFQGIVVVSAALRLICCDALNWITPSGSSETIDSTDDAACDEVTPLDANSATSFNFSVSEQTPDGGFAVGQDMNYNDILTCNLTKIRSGFSASYVVVLRAENTGNEQADKTLTITVTGLNLHSPVFQGVPYDVTVKQNEIGTKYTIGTYLKNITVTDEDAGQTVTVTTDAGNPFDIDGFSSTLFGIKIFNETGLSELPTPYMFTLTASDNGNPIRSSTVTVTVTIESSGAQTVVCSVLFLLVYEMLTQLLFF